MTRGGKAATHGHPRALGAVDTCDKTFCASRKSSIANKPAAGRGTSFYDLLTLDEGWTRNLGSLRWVLMKAKQMLACL